MIQARLPRTSYSFVWLADPRRPYADIYIFEFQPALDAGPAVGGVGQALRHASLTANIGCTKPADATTSAVVRLSPYSIEAGDRLNTVVRTSVNCM